MALTPETIVRHELIGLRVRVAAADNPDLVGIEGRVVGETMRTLRVVSSVESVEPRSTEHSMESRTESGEADDARVKQVPKQGSTFEFALTDEPAVPAKGTGTASKRESETAGGRSGQSGSFSGPRSEARRTSSAGGEGVAYVTVDGDELLSRPALRTEANGDSKWR